MQMVHVQAELRRVTVRLTDHEIAAWLWRRLRTSFPEALGCTIMPDHLHVVTPAKRLDAAQRLMRGLVSGLSRSSTKGNQLRWERTAPPAALPDRKHVRRLLRNLALHPCRASLVRDPLEWPWSTHRDVMGAIADPWVEAPRLARALGRSARGFARAHHQHVSTAPEVDPRGTPLPRPAKPTNIAQLPLADLAAAAAAAARSTPDAIGGRTLTRQLFLQLADRHGWQNTKQLAELCGITRRAVQQTRRRIDEGALAAAELCLGDARLRRWE